jgi:hypothetical protein
MASNITLASECVSPVCRPKPSEPVAGFDRLRVLDSRSEGYLFAAPLAIGEL